MASFFKSVFINSLSYTGNAQFITLLLVIIKLVLLFDDPVYKSLLLDFNETLTNDTEQGAFLNDITRNHTVILKQLQIIPLLYQNPLKYFKQYHSLSCVYN